MLRFLLLMSLSIMLACPAWAKIYMYVDAEGGKGATDRREAIPAGAKVTAVIDAGGGTDSYSAPRKSGSGKSSVKTPSPANFPRIDSSTQQKRDEVRRAILEEEMQAERKNLEQARRSLASVEKPLPGENASSPAYLARLKHWHNIVQNHERNIDAIQKELNTVR